MAIPSKRSRETAARSHAIDTSSVSYRTDHLAILRKLVLGVPGVREGKMFGHPAFFVGRRMFACVYGAGISFKLPAYRANSLIQAGDAAPFQPYGKSKMREWIEITRARSDDYCADRAILSEAISFASGYCSDRSAP